MPRIIPDPCTVVRTNPHPGRGSVLVLGTPRGGTSVVAGISHMLGVPMGIDIDPSNMEDRAFRALVTGPACAEQSAAFFAELHHGHRLAGVKDPTAIDWLPSVYHTVPDPVLVVVSRDVYAVAQREEACGSQFLDALHGAIRRKYAVLDFVERVADPLIVVSYERLMDDPRHAVESLARFLLGGIDRELVDRIVPLVRPHTDMPNDVNFVAARADHERECVVQLRRRRRFARWAS
jgi:hypothetical protein